MSAKILAFAGSLKKASWNKKLVQVCAAGAESTGAEVTVIDLNDYELPIFNEDIESETGPPDNAQRLKYLFKQHNGLLIACPEYNSSITPVLKNTIDWVSRAAEGEKPLECFAGKVAGLVAASPGGLGGLRGLVHVRAILQNIQVTVVPNQMAVSKVHEAFDDQGNMTDEGQRERVMAVGKAVAEMAAKLNS